MKRKLSRPGVIVLCTLAPACAFSVCVPNIIKSIPKQKNAIISYDSETIEIVSNPKIEVGKDLTIEFKVKDAKANTNCIDFSKFNITIEDTNKQLVLSQDYTIDGDAIEIKGSAITSTDISINLPTRERQVFSDTDWKYIVPAIHVFEASKQEEAAMKALCNQFSDIEYISDIDPTITDPNRQIEAHLHNFIGKTIKVSLNNNADHEVRIIGINHDEILNDQGQKTGKYAAFTFDSVQVLSDSAGSYCEINWETKDLATNYAYCTPDHKSVLYNSLNAPSDTPIEWYQFGGSTGQVINKSVYVQLSDYFTTTKGLSVNPLKNVNKQVAICDNPEEEARASQTYSVKDYSCYCFPMSHKELNSPAIPQGGGAAEAKEEGLEYAYWIEHSQDKDRIKKPTNSSYNAFNYHLVSPNTAQGLKTGWYHVLNVTNTGAMQTDRITYKDSGELKYKCVSFAFCI